MVIHSRQQPESLPADQLIGQEVHAPDLIGLPSWRSCLAELNALPPTWLSPTDSQAFFTVEPVDELLVHDPPFTTQKNPEPLMPIVHPAGRQVTESSTKLGLLVTPALVAEARSSEPKYPACPTLGNAIRDLHLPHQNTLYRGPHIFLESTSCSIFLSRLTSATNCWSLLVFSSNIRRLRSSAMPSPANRFFHR